MPTISTHIRCKRSMLTNEAVYYTGHVTYWTNGAAWLFQRSFAAEGRCKRWIETKRATLTMYGPELAQAAE